MDFLGSEKSLTRKTGERVLMISYTLSSVFPGSAQNYGPSQQEKASNMKVETNSERKNYFHEMKC